MQTINASSNKRVLLEEPLFTEAELQNAMLVDKSITQHIAEIYMAGIEKQENGDTVSEAQAKAIGITHKKIQTALKKIGTPVSKGTVMQSDSGFYTPVFNNNGVANEGVELTNAQLIDRHLGNLIAELQALRELFKEMQ